MNTYLFLAAIRSMLLELTSNSVILVNSHLTFNLTLLNYDFELDIKSFLFIFGNAL